jgi:hypothetical protein
MFMPQQDEIDDVKDSFGEELERTFEKYPKYHTKILFGDFNAKVSRKYICKPTTGMLRMELILSGKQLERI